MRIFLAGATGIVGWRLAGLLRHAKHEVVGMTRNPAKTEMLRALGAFRDDSDGGVGSIGYLSGA